MRLRANALHLMLKMFLDKIVERTNESIFRYEPVIRYLRSRGVTEDEIKKYKLGFSKIIGVPNDDSHDRERFMDEMWKGRKIENMILFPIHDVMGNVTGLLARSLETKMFKTFISDEAKFTGFVFGLFQALPSIYESGRVFVVEGAFDLFAFAKVFPNTVSTLTSGLYKNQYELLSFFCERIITVFDSDEAGREAAEKLKWRKDVIDLNIGFKDPAQFLEHWGPEQFREKIEKKIKDIPPW